MREREGAGLNELHRNRHTRERERERERERARRRKRAGKGGEEIECEQRHTWNLSREVNVSIVKRREPQRLGERSPESARGEDASGCNRIIDVAAYWIVLALSFAVRSNTSSDV